MPLFGRSADNVSVPDRAADDHSPPRRSSFFGRRRSVSPAATTTTARSTNSHATSPNRRGLLHRNDEDPSIRAAHDRVLSAEAAEKEADKALLHARSAVKDARDHVKRLEKEAAEEARLAKIKQKHAASISKRAKPLGRHDRT